MSALAFAIPRLDTKFIQPDGSITREWFLFLSALLQTVGGPSVVAGGGISPIDVHQQFEEYAASSIEAQEALRAVDELRNVERPSDTRIDELLRQTNELRNEIASTRNDLAQFRSLFEELAARMPEPYNDQLRSRVESLEDRLA